jgi:hypothetical protein
MFIPLSQNRFSYKVQKINLQLSQQLSAQQGTTTALFMICLQIGQKYSGGIGFSLSTTPD